MVEVVDEQVLETSGNPNVKLLTADRDSATTQKAKEEDFDSKMEGNDDFSVQQDVGQTVRESTVAENAIALRNEESHAGDDV